MRFSSVSRMSYMCITSVSREFNECFPDCILTITPADTPQLLEMTRRHEIDLAIIVTPSDLKEIEAKPLFSDELILVTSPIHEFAQSGRARMAKIAQERMVLYNKGSHTFDLVEQAFRQNKLLMQNYIELGSMEAIKELVKINYGVSFLASWTVENEINTGSLMQISTGQRKLIRNWGISYANY